METWSKYQDRLLGDRYVYVVVVKYNYDIYTAPANGVRGSVQSVQLHNGLKIFRDF